MPMGKYTDYLAGFLIPDFSCKIEVAQQLKTVTETICLMTFLFFSPLWYARQNTWWRSHAISQPIIDNISTCFSKDAASCAFSIFWNQRKFTMIWIYYGKLAFGNKTDQMEESIASVLTEAEPQVLGEHFWLILELGLGKKFSWNIPLAHIVFTATACFKACSSSV